MKKPILAALACAAAIVACAGNQGQPVVAPAAIDDAGATLPSALDAAPRAAASTDASEPEPVAQSSDGDAGPLVPPRNLCGCKLCAPVVSQDTCTKDADCAGEKPCHATKCVAASKAVLRTPTTMCTRVMMCGTTDANACSCYQGKCALVPRP